VRWAASSTPGTESPASGGGAAREPSHHTLRRASSPSFIRGLNQRCKVAIQLTSHETRAWPRSVDLRDLVNFSQETLTCRVCQIALSTTLAEFASSVMMTGIRMQQTCETRCGVYSHRTCPNATRPGQRPRPRIPRGANTQRAIPLCSTPRLNRRGTGLYRPEVLHCWPTSTICKRDGGRLTADFLSAAIQAQRNTIAPCPPHRKNASVAALTFSRRLEADVSVGLTS